ncbi:MAG: 16S rRNA (cytosine(1402)-N(4))-methyltransferase RsmH [Desulfobacteraceae bacterium]|jgi:16S rRNA (cytosine1402-N4)-methyltransferase
MTFRHVSAMLQEAVACLACRPGGTYVDGTLGGAGHARAICQQMMPDGRLVGIDQDADAVANARRVLEPYLDNIQLFHGNFSHLSDYLDQLKIPAVDGILLDLGLSQHQLEASGRGFSFSKDEPLDMRMDTRNTTNAADLVNRLEEKELSRIFMQYGEERWSKRIARAVVDARGQGDIQSSRQLAELICAAVPAKAAAMQKIHPATRVFQALRIAVNQELDRLAQFLESSLDLLSSKGRLCILSFHSLEDRMVKHKFKAFAAGCDCPPDMPVCGCGKQPRVRLLTRRVLRPTAEEVKRNPMARSTRLRAIEKL